MVPVKRRNNSTLEDGKNKKNTVRVKCACLLATYLIDLQRYTCRLIIAQHARLECKEEMRRGRTAHKKK